MQKYARLAGAVLLPAVLILAGCGGSKPAEAPKEATPAAQPAPAAQTQPQTQPQAQPQTQTQSQPEAPKTMEISIKLGDHFFEPKLISIPLGTKVKLTVTNGGEKKHDFTVEGAYKIEGDLLSPSGTQTFEFVADKAGQFKILCTQRGHADKGMEGILEVK